MSRYTSKRAAEVRNSNTSRNRGMVMGNRPQPVPKWLKQRITMAILESRDKGDFQPRSFGCKTYFLPRMTVEVVWLEKIPHSLPRELGIWKTTYRLVHRTRDFARGEAFGGYEPHNQLSNGYKWAWWKPRNLDAEQAAEERFFRNKGFSFR